jgi:hypothetical protein
LRTDLASAHITDAILDQYKVMGLKPEIDIQRLVKNEVATSPLTLRYRLDSPDLFQRRLKANAPWTHELSPQTTNVIWDTFRMPILPTEATYIA